MEHSRGWFGGREKHDIVPFQPDVRDGTRQGVLAVQEIDFRIEINGENHRTNKFNLMTRSVDRCLVVRRGQAFELDILLKRPYDASKDALSLIFYVADGKTRGPSGETSAAVPLVEKGSETLGTWSATYEGQVDSHLMVAVNLPADCVVAAWRLDVDTRLSGGSSLSYKHPLPIYVLFNPWCLTDTVYMEGQSKCEEYVLDDGGLIYRGLHNRIKRTPWNYAQYEKDILECALHLVTKNGKVTGRARSDPILTCRALSAAVQSEDGNGVIEGKWAPKDADYRGGTHPVDWVGSLDILQKYYKKKRPVKYGNCWVYAGVLITVCRALGIPCCPVSGYNIAVDSNGSFTVDMIIDHDGQIVNKDSVWNFHVWTEIWLNRPDLGPEYVGWQALDAAPRRPSEGLYRCGPTSVLAIRNKDMQRNHDTARTFSKLNADRVIWQYLGKGQPLKLLSYDTGVIGRNISTKSIGKIARDDITNRYKIPEGTGKERMTMEKVLRRSKNTFARYGINEEFNEVTFDFAPFDDTKIGQNFNVVLRIWNRSNFNSHQVKGFVRVNTATHTGVKGAVVKFDKFDFNLEPKGRKMVNMLVSFNDYYKKLVDQASFIIACLGKVVDAKFDFFSQDDFRLRNANIEISIDNKPISRQECIVTLKMENPLPIGLTKGMFYVQGPGLDKELLIHVNKKVESGEFATVNYKLTPPWAGRHQISAKFKSREIRDVDGVLSIMVASHVLP